MDTEEGPARRDVEVTDTSTTTNMNSWTDTGWIINSGYGLGVIDAPPPKAASKFAGELFVAQLNVGDMLQGLEPEGYFEFVPDQLLAQEAEREYDTYGIEGTIPTPTIGIGVLDPSREYQIRLTSHAVRDLDDLPTSDLGRVDMRLSSLADNPRPSGAIKLWNKSFRVRVGRWRSIYLVDDAERVVEIIAVRRRGEGT